MRQLIFLFFSMSTVLSYTQEQTYSFTLQEAIDFALENNRQVKNAQRDIEAAKRQKWETTAIGLPQINTSIGYNNWLKQQVSLLPAAAFDNTESVIEIVDKYFDAQQDNFDINKPEGFIAIPFGTKQTMNATATMSMMLFDGSYLVGLQSAKVYLEISKNAKTKTNLEVEKSVIQAYGNVLLAEESVRIMEQNRSSLEKNLQETQAIFENGMTEEEDVEQLQITLSTVENKLNHSESLKFLAYQMLNFILGIDVYSETRLLDNLEDLTEQSIFLDLLETEENLPSNIDYKIAMNDLKSKELMLKLEKSRALPKLNAFINGGYAGNNDAFTFLDKDQRWFGSSMVGITLDIPIFSSLKRSASTQKASIHLDKAEENLLEVAQQLKVETQQAKSNYQFAIDNYQTQKNNLKLAERIEKKNQTKYFEGLATSFELRQAQIQLYAAQQNYLQSMLEIINTKANLETLLTQID